MNSFYNYINIHTQKRSNSDIFEIVNSYNVKQEGYFSVGIHPWDILNTEINYLLVDSLASLNNTLAIGEIGLDRAIEADIDIQKTVFYKQLEIAKKYNKPVVLHCVRAHSDFQQIIKQNQYTYIFHGFNANLTIANYLINNGSYLSFGAELLINTKLQNIFKQLPKHKIFFETDESDVNIKDIYIFAAKLLKINLQELQEVIQGNFTKVFGIDVRKLA